MSLVVRAASTDDVVALHGLIRDHAAFEQSAATLTLAELAAVIITDEPPATLLVAEVANGIVGYAAVTFDWSLWRARFYAHLDCLFVAGGARGSGVGARLLDAAVELAFTKGADRLEWQTPTWNKKAAQFYRRAGAESTAKTRFRLPLRRPGPQCAPAHRPGWGAA